MAVVFLALLIFDLLLFAVEIDRCLSVRGSASAYRRYKVGSEEDKVVKDRDQRQQVEGERRHQHRVEEKRRVNVCKPFDLDRNNEHKKHLRVGEKGRKGEEHRQIDVICSYIYTLLCYEIDDKSVDDSQEYAAENKDVEPCGAPFSFKSAAYPVIKIEKQQRPHAQILRDENKGDEPPDLSSHYELG